MQDENTGGKRDYPTDSSTAGPIEGRDASPEQSLDVENPPRADAAERTGDCSGADPRPVAQSTREGDNPCDGVEILDSSCDPEAGDADPREASQLTEQLRIATLFDAAEAREPTPETLTTRRVYGYRLRLEGDDLGEEITTTHAVRLGDAR